MPTTVLALAAALVTFLLPKRYESEATILVEGQQVPERYVTSNTTSDLREVLLIMTDAILSRTSLLQIIDQFGLYSNQRNRLSAEQLVDLMRSNITIQPTQKGPDAKGLNAFAISFSADDPHAAQAVTERLTTLFIKENNESREEQSTGTTKFLADKLDEAYADLKQQDIRVRDFKMKNLGELPEQREGNLAILTGLHSQLQNSMSALERAREQQAYLQSLLSQYQDIAASGLSVSGSAIANPIDAMKLELTKLQNERAELLARYTEKYPDVVKIDEQIRETQGLLAAANKTSGRQGCRHSRHPRSGQVDGKRFRLGAAQEPVEGKRNRNPERLGGPKGASISHRRVQPPPQPDAGAGARTRGCAAELRPVQKDYDNLLRQEDELRDGYQLDQESTGRAVPDH